MFYPSVAPGSSPTFGAVTAQTLDASSITASPSITSSDGISIKTKSGGGAGDSLQLIDSSTNSNKSIRLDGSTPSNLQILNSAFSTVISQFNDNGYFQTINGISPGNFGSMVTSNAIWLGSGVPSASNGSNGDLYIRYDTPGTTSQRLYMKSAGAWVALAV